MYLAIIAVLLILLMLVALWYVRRSIFGWMNDTPDVTGPGFTLADLRQLHQSGKITDEEFERTKQQVLHSVKMPTAGKKSGQ